jgi:hypothetical protein
VPGPRPAGSYNRCGGKGLRAPEIAIIVESRPLLLLNISTGKEGIHMETQDLELIKKHIASDVSLKKLYEEHLELEQKLETYNQKNSLTPTEELEKKNLKKYKLRGRDQIEFILRKYRDAEKRS